MGAAAPGPPATRGVRGEIALLATGYAVLVAGLTWPLLRTAGTALPRTFGAIGGDQYYLGWALAWQTHALSTAPATLPDANVYWPTPLALFYGTPGFALVPVFAPLFLATGNPTLALNGTLLIAHVLTATALHWAAKRWTGSHAAGFVAAASYLGTRTVLQLGAFLPQYTALAIVPIVMAIVVDGRLGRRRTLLLALLIAAQSLADVAYVAPPLLLTLGIGATVMLRTPATRRDAGALALACAVAVVLLVPVLAGYVSVRLANPEIRSQTIWPVVGQLMPFAFGSALWPARGPLVVDPLFAVPIVLGLVATVSGLARLDARRRRGWACAGLFALVGAVIAWWLPRLFPAARELIAATVARDPLRFGYPALVGLCLLAGLGFEACADVARRAVPPALRRAAVATLLLAFLAGRIARLPLPLGAYPTLAAVAPGAEVAALRAGTGPVAAAFGTKPTPLLNALAMYRSIGHWRPLLNGYSSYFPAGFPERMQTVARLPDPEALRSLRRDAGVTTIVVYSGGLPELAFGPWLRAIEAGTLPDVRVRHRDRDALVLAVAPDG